MGFRNVDRVQFSGLNAIAIIEILQFINKILPNFIFISLLYNNQLLLKKDVAPVMSLY
jgi:hypothetical protein